MAVEESIGKIMDAEKLGIEDAGGSVGAMDFSDFPLLGSGPKLSLNQQLLIELLGDDDVLICGCIGWVRSKLAEVNRAKLIALNGQQWYDEMLQRELDKLTKGKENGDTE